MNSSSNEKKGAPPVYNSSLEKLCRTCMDFRTWMKMNQNKAKTEKSGKKESESSNPLFNISTEDEYGGRGSRRRETRETTAVEASPSNDGEEMYPKSGLAAKYGCPADSLSLGRGSWRLLHTIAAYYPESPTDDDKDDINNFITLFSKFYPCPPCAEDFRQWIRENPPDVSSKLKLSKWFCNAHNEVNRKLNKPEFDCTLYNQRWLDGWSDGSCY